MKPKRPPLPPLPPAVPPPFRVVVAESPEKLEASVCEHLDAGHSIEPGTTLLSTVAGVVVLSQPCSRDPAWDKHVRTRLSTQKVLNNGGIY